MLITVIIPACKRPESLARCLRALSSDAEVVVTDDSPDDSVREMMAREFPSIRRIDGPRRGPAANRNHGARSTTSEWIAFLDDDCVPAPGWLQAIVAHASRGADVVEGRTTCPDACDDPFTEQVENLSGNNFWSCNLAIRRDAFFDLGCFDEDFTEAAGEDMELAWRIRKHGLKTMFVSEAEVYHPARKGSWPLLWRRTWMIRWMVLYRMKTGESPALGSSFMRIYMTTISREAVATLRLTAQLVTRRDDRRPRTQLFNVVHRWITFPWVVAWLILWEHRFRALLANRLPETSRPEAE